MNPLGRMESLEEKSRWWAPNKSPKYLMLKLGNPTGSLGRLPWSCLSPRGPRDLRTARGQSNLTTIALLEVAWTIRDMLLPVSVRVLGSIHRCNMVTSLQGGSH